jgi:hypothetical protein
VTTTNGAPAALDAREVALQLRQLWNPAPPRPAGAVEDHDEDDEYGDGCGCGGEDGWGRLICNCAGGCSCPSCAASARHYYQRCSRKGCSDWTRYKVEAWRPDGATRVQASTVGLDGDGWVDLDERPTPLYGFKTACGQPHAYEIAAEIRARYNRPEDVDGKRWRVQIEPWTYRPDTSELPHPLGLVRDLGESVQFWTATLADHLNPYSPDRHRKSPNLDDTRRAVARLVEALADLDTVTGPVPEITTVEALPTDPIIGAVRTEPAGGGLLFARRIESGWYCGNWEGPGPMPTFETDEDLLAAYPILYGWPTTRLILPGDVDEVDA